MPQWLQSIDEAVLRFIALHLRIPALNGAVGVFTHLGDAGAIFLLITAVMLCVRRWRRAGCATLTGLGLGLIVTNLTIKPLISRPRPWVVMEGLRALIAESDPNSFPSGHTCAAFAFAVALSFELPRTWQKAAVLLAAALMGYSRLYVGVHFPSDVLAGAVIGSLCGVAAHFIVARVCAAIKDRR